jgi:hypothetical protein
MYTNCIRQIRLQVTIALILKDVSLGAKLCENIKMLQSTSYPFIVTHSRVISCKEDEY